MSSTRKATATWRSSPGPTPPPTPPTDRDHHPAPNSRWPALSRREGHRGTGRGAESPTSPGVVCRADVALRDGQVADEDGDGAGEHDADEAGADGEPA